MKIFSLFIILMILATVLSGVFFMVTFAANDNLSSFKIFQEIHAKNIKNKQLINK